MFKKLKDKLAEEVKSSPQRIQQFAQAAQAAVTSASSSISDITNNDLFSIGGDDTPTQNSPAPRVAVAPRSYQDASLSQTPTPPASDGQETPTNDDQYESLGALSAGAAPRLRKLSTGSAASDVSFRLPRYDSPNMYHLQSDVEMSEAESVPGSLSLERVTKEQVYAAYRRTQERYTKYRARYSDLARHYSNLERENAKARAVLEETQDKALRRISELREQCALEQSAKAHLENVLRVELDEKNLKIETLNTKIKLLNNGEIVPDMDKSDPISAQQVNLETPESNAEPVQNLIDLNVNEKNQETSSPPIAEVSTLTNKIQKMEQLAAKYKESLKILKEKNSQLTTEIAIVSNELDKKGKENEQLQVAVKQLTDAREQIQELRENNIELQSKLHNFDKTKAEELAAVQSEVDKAQNDLIKLTKQMEVLTKREEENAISLAENKLSIHKELETKEAEIRLLTSNLKEVSNEAKSFELIILELKQTLKKLEDDKANLNSKILEMQSKQPSISDLEYKLEELRKSLQSQEHKNAKLTEEYNCLELEMKQESAEKLAMIDRNNYLENRIQQLIEDDSKKTKQLTENQNNANNTKYQHMLEVLQQERDSAINEMISWQQKHNSLESEIKEERVELVKLQSEIEKLLCNDENLKLENIELKNSLEGLKVQLQETEQNLCDSEQKFNTEVEKLNSKLKEVTEELEKAYLDMDVKSKMQEDMLQATKEEHKNAISMLIRSCRDKLNEVKENFESGTEVVSLRLTLDEMAALLQELNDINHGLAKQLRCKNVEIMENEDVINRNKELEEQIWFDLERVSSENMSNKEKVAILESENRKLKSNADQIVEEIAKLQIEVSELKKSHESIQLEKDSLVAKISQMEQEELTKNENERKIYNETLKKNEEIKKNVEKLKLELESLMAEKHKLHNQLLEAQYDSKEKEAEINKYRDNNEVWEQKLASILEENNVIHKKCDWLKQEKENSNENILKLQQKLSESEKKIKQQDESKIEKEFLDLRTSQLENDLKFANLERDKVQHEYQLLKSDMTDLEKEKNNKIQDLTSDIEKIKLENSELDKKLHEVLGNLERENKNNKEKSEKISNLESCIEELKSKHEDLLKQFESLKSQETNLLKELKIFQSERETLNEKFADLTTSENELTMLRHEYDKLKEDKGRLVSDIEGLQVHLTKVSKDNSQLNDRIRDMIASDENAICVNKNETLSKLDTELDELKDSLRAQQDKIEDLERQNSILVEEKLELEDQLKFQNSRENGNISVRDSTEKDLEITRLQEKNSSLTEMKSYLESKLAEMELIGRSGDSNIAHLEQKNEKLRLSNDKLERRLDEALVSLRHLRALEENTELEYLRNILYEYLTGTGAHSITLAKVLAAVVKFDDRQTQLVLQRERERQGLLGQLGLL